MTNEPDLSVSKEATAETSGTPQTNASIREALLQSYESSVIDFVWQRLELAVPESRIVNQLLSHSFNKSEADALVNQLASDPNLKVSRVTDLYEKELLELVADRISRDVSGERIVQILAIHKIDKEEARRLVDAMIADPELHRRSKETISTEVGIGFWNLGAGLFCFLAGAGAIIGMITFGYVFFLLMAISVAVSIWGMFQFAMGVAQISSAKARRSQ